MPLQIVDYLGLKNFIPHGFCLNWTPTLLWLHVLSDAIIVISYYFIPLVIFYFIRRRHDLPYTPVFLMFAALIVACGTTHLLSIITIWIPLYWLDGWLKAVAAIISFVTAGLMVWVVPQALQLPSTVTQLRSEMEEKEKATQAKNLALMAMQESEERLQFALETIHAGAWDLDLVNHTVSRSKEHDRIFGYPELLPEWTYEMFLEHILPEDRMFVHESFQKTISTRGEWHFECRIKRADGQIRTILAAGHHRINGFDGTLRMAGIVQDITEQKQAEEQLKDLTQRLNYHIDNSPLAVIEWGPDMRLVRWSGTAEHMFGWKAEEVLGKSLDDFRWVYEEDAAQVAEVISTLMTGNHPPQFSANRNYRKDGEVVYCEWYNSSLLDNSGKLRSILSLVLDVTARVKLEAALQQHSIMLESKVKERTAELRKKDQLLLQQSRLAAMGEMINNIAHQWRQPLNVLGLNIQRLSLYYDLGKFNKEFLDTSTQDAMNLIQHMSQTIDDFRHFFQPDKEKTDFSVNQAIQQSVNLVKDSFNHHQIKLCIQSDKDVQINGYPNEFAQVILNILQNARDVFVERGIANRLVTIATSTETNKTVTTITDNAGGIPENIIDKIFDPYFSTKGIQGSGIGLYMSKNIIENNLNGKLSVRNVDKGAEFRIDVNTTV